MCRKSSLHLGQITSAALPHVLESTVSGDILSNWNTSKEYNQDSQSNIKWQMIEKKTGDV